MDYRAKAIDVKNKLEAWVKRQWLKRQPGDAKNPFDVAHDFVVKQGKLTLELYFINHGFRNLVATFNFKDSYVFIRCEYSNGASGPDGFETADQIENFFNDGLAKVAADWMKTYKTWTDGDPANDAIA